MSKKFQTLEAWVGDALADQDKQDPSGNVKPCTGLAALYVTANGATKEVHAIPLPPGKTYNPSSLASKLQTRIEGYAQDLGNGTHQFMVHAFYGGEAQPSAAHPVRTIDGQVITGDEWGRIAETPNEKGLTAQLMRHLEAKDTMLMKVLEGTFGQWASERTKLQAEVNDAYEIVREVMMRQASDNHAHNMAQLEFQRTSQERKALMSMVPAIANGLTGKEIFPKASADTAMLDAMARNMTPDMVDMAVAAGMIPREMQAAVVARILETRQRDHDEQRELARVPPANRDGAQDVQGN